MEGPLAASSSSHLESLNIYFQETQLPRVALMKSPKRAVLSIRIIPPKVQYVL